MRRYRPDHYQKDQKPWRLRNPDKRNKQRKRYYDKSRVHAKRYKRHWTLDEDVTILFYGARDSELSIMLDRSVKAIQIHRCKLMKLWNALGAKSKTDDS